MKTNTSSETLAEKISAGIKKAQKEIEEFALQFSLGKAEASDKFEEVKKDFNSKIERWKAELTKLQLKAKMEELQLQLALGKADAKDLFEAQRKKILQALHELEADLRSNPEFNNEIKKFKLKLEILKLQFELKRFKVKEEFKDEMAEASIKIDKLFKKFGEKWDDAKKKSSDFSEEIKQSYDHLKKAVKSL